ncbi:MAG: AmmeMemoRadiSam system protein A [Chloroflexota bacterium]
MEDRLTDEERSILLKLARQAIDTAAQGRQRPALDLQALPERLRKPGATFVTLTRHGALRGCIGALEPYQALAEDVCEHAVAAAMNDFRFPPVNGSEVPELSIEISRLTLPQTLAYEQPGDLLEKLRPNVDGVILRDGVRRATFLPQVWEKLPDPAEFLSHLCQKMGAAHDLWRRKMLQVEIYQVEEFHE